jgi:nucleoside diphosphate kinase
MLTAEQCSDFYSEHYGKKFFPSLVAFMTSAPILMEINPYKPKLTQIEVQSSTQ